MSAFGGLALIPMIPPPGFCPWTRWDFRPSDPLIAHPWKKFCGRPMEVNILYYIYLDCQTLVLMNVIESVHKYFAYEWTIRLCVA